MFRYMTLLFPLRLKDWICQLFGRQGCWWVWLKNVEMPWSIKSRFLWAEKKNCYQLDLKMFWMELWWNGKGLAVLGLEKNRQTWTCRNIEKSGNMSKKLCLMWQGCCSVWLKNVEYLWNNVKLIPLSWKGSSMENVDSCQLLKKWKIIWM